MSVRLRPLRAVDEAQFVAAHREVQERDGYTFGLEYRYGMRWQHYLSALAAQRRGERLAPDRVPSTFLVAEAHGQIVGRTSIRHQLNALLERDGGHIGYVVVPAHRRRGYATEILRQSLILARAIGVDDVLLTCDDDNVGSATTIERCGGVLESVVPTDHGAHRPRSCQTPLLDPLTRPGPIRRLCRGGSARSWRRL